MKKKYLLAAVALVGILAGVGGTVAYFTDYDTTANVFTIGDVSGTLSEPAWNPDDDHVMGADAEFAKDPRVSNTSENDAYARVHVTVHDMEQIRAACDNPSLEMSTLFQGHDEAIWKSAGEPIEASGAITYTYVYTKVLEAGKTSDPVFTSVKFPSSFDNNVLDINDFVIEISADLVQASSFNSPDAAFAGIDS